MLLVTRADPASTGHSGRSTHSANAAIHDLGGLRYFVAITSRVVMAPGILVIVGCIAFGPTFLTLLYGETAGDMGASVLPIVGLGFLAPIAMLTMRGALVGAGRTRLIGALSLVEATLNVALSITLVWLFDLGILGIALGTSTAMVLVSGASLLRCALRLLDFRFREFGRQTLAYWLPAALIFEGVAFVASRLATQPRRTALMGEVLLATLLFVPVAWFLLVPRELRERMGGRLFGKGRPGSG